MRILSNNPTNQPVLASEEVSATLLSDEQSIEARADIVEGRGNPSLVMRITLSGRQVAGTGSWIPIGFSEWDFGLPESNDPDTGQPITHLFLALARPSWCAEVRSILTVSTPVQTHLELILDE
jgi:hypothetical protein